MNEHFWNTVWNTTKSELRSAVGNNPGTPTFEMPDNITYMMKVLDIGKVLVQKTMKKSRTGASYVDKTFDWGVGVSITLNESNGYNLMKANYGPYVPQQPENFAVKMVGVAKRNGAWHGSLLEF